MKENLIKFEGIQFKRIWCDLTSPIEIEENKLNEFSNL